KYKGEFSGIKTQLAVGYAKINTILGTGFAAYGNKGVDNFQMQLGLMDPATGIFGSIAYQIDDMDGAAAGASDDTDAFWTKVGIKKAFNSLGDTAISMNYGLYMDQFGTVDAGLTGSEVERIGIEVNQYFGSSFILYGVWEMLDLETDGPNSAAYNSADELNTFRLGGTYFF
ncbi:MAG: porin, partial [Gammaproteobacteria bacterium]